MHHIVLDLDTPSLILDCIVLVFGHASFALFLVFLGWKLWSVRPWRRIP